MAVAKRQQGSPIFLTLVIFIALFVIATIFSVVYYVKSEEQTTNFENAKNELARWVRPSEQGNVSTVVGTVPAGNSATGVLIDNIDNLATMIAGKQPMDASVQVKFEAASKAVKDTVLPYFVKYVTAEPNDVNSTSLTRVISVIGTKLDNAIQQELDLQNKYNQLQVRLDSSDKSHSETVESLKSQLQVYNDQVEKFKKDYANLQQQLQQTSDEKVNGLTARTELAEKARNDLQQELDKTQATLMTTTERLNKITAQLESIKPLPDSNALAYQSDGQVILYDPQTKIVHINLGSDDGVYRGLTFAVYDKDLPIPKDGKGKAEIEVYDVDKTISTARLITPVNPRNPIIKGDLIANLVWDKNQKLYFVVAGNFEHEGDTDKIKALIIKMHGAAEDSVSVNTDFVILGTTPVMLQKPTQEQIDLNPTVLGKYEASVKDYQNYKQLEQDAKTFSIPILNFDRFLYFTGYKVQVTKPGAF
jgi:hypothetical protein